MRPRFHYRRQWWYARRQRLFNVLFGRCVNFERHVTWRHA